MICALWVLGSLLSREKLVMGNIIKKICIVILSIPILILGIVFDLIKFPFLTIFIPVWLIIELISILKGEESDFIYTIASFMFMGCIFWAEMVGLPIENWMNEETIMSTAKRVYTCTVCGRTKFWDSSWSYYGGWLYGDVCPLEDIIVTCSKKCRQVAMKKIKSGEWQLPKLQLGPGGLTIVKGRKGY